MPTSGCTCNGHAETLAESGAEDAAHATATRGDDEVYPPLETDNPADAAGETSTDGLLPPWSCQTDGGLEVPGVRKVGEGEAGLEGGLRLGASCYTALLAAHLGRLKKSCVEWRQGSCEGGTDEERRWGERAQVDAAVEIRRETRTSDAVSSAVEVLVRMRSKGVLPDIGTFSCFEAIVFTSVTAGMHARESTRGTKTKGAADGYNLTESVATRIQAQVCTAGEEGLLDPVVAQVLALALRSAADLPCTDTHETAAESEGGEHPLTASRELRVGVMAALRDMALQGDAGIGMQHVAAAWKLADAAGLAGAPGVWQAMLSCVVALHRAERAGDEHLHLVLSLAPQVGVTREEASAELARVRARIGCKDGERDETEAVEEGPRPPFCQEEEEGAGFDTSASANEECPPHGGHDKEGRGERHSENASELPDADGDSEVRGDQDGILGVPWHKWEAVAANASGKDLLSILDLCRVVGEGGRLGGRVGWVGGSERGKEGAKGGWG